MIRVLILMVLAGPVAADVVVPTRTIPAQTTIGPDDIMLRDITARGGIADPGLVIGLETRVALFPGRPIQPGDIGQPAVVDRNQIIPLVYDRGGLVIKTEGRALDRAGAGDVIRVMNLASRSTITATILADGSAIVGQ